MITPNPLASAKRYSLVSNHHGGRHVERPTMGSQDDSSLARRPGIKSLIKTETIAFPFDLL
jgi:hypothetical protein